MKKKIIIGIMLLSLLLIASRSLTPSAVVLEEGDSVLVGCPTGFNIDIQKSISGYQVIKITCPYMGYPGPNQGDYCGYIPPLPSGE